MYGSRVHWYGPRIAESIIILTGLYFLPTIIAGLRHHNAGGVIIVNLLLGWTLIGWVIALVMACGNRSGARDGAAYKGQPLP